jgi:hypothetical protein
MTTIHTVEAAYHPKNKMGFLIDWLLTLKCNYDCSYCGIGPSGHDNSTQHPSFEKCIKMLKQLYQYTDAMMHYKKNSFKDAILNIYGGEALYHPAIETLWRVVCEHVEGITFSYHSQGSEKMKTLFKKNIDHAVKTKKEHDIIVCMYPHVRYWQDCLNFLEYCNKNNLNARPKLLDGPLGTYNQEQLEQLTPYIKNFDDGDIKKINKDTRIDSQTRGCCGGRAMCTNRNMKEYTTLIPRNMGFEGWHCSSNQFFLHGNSVYGEYYTNKDCRVRLDGTAGPIATVDAMDVYIEQIKAQSQKTGLPTLQCVQKTCLCGTCAPKSLYKENLESILKIYNTDEPVPRL